MGVVRSEREEIIRKMGVVWNGRKGKEREGKERKGKERKGWKGGEEREGGRRGDESQRKKMGLVRR